MGNRRDVTIAELAAMVRHVVGDEGGIVDDTSKPDGTPRKLTDVGLVHRTGARAAAPSARPAR